MFQGLSTALTALYAGRQALEVTGNNIANVNTKGYSRERVEQATVGNTSVSFWATNSKTGAGVSITDVSRITDQFLQSRSLNEHANQGRLNTVNSAYTTIQTAFAEPGDNGLQHQLSLFWSAWDDLGNHPGETATRSQVVEQGQTLVSTFQQISTSLDDLSKASVQKLKADASEINTIAQNIADLNVAIQSATNNGDSPNALLDQRDQLISQLSDVAAVTVQPTSSNSVSVSIGGVALVRDNQINQLQVDDTGSPVVLRWDSDGDVNTVTDGQQASVMGGDVAGLLDVVNNVVPKYKSLIDGVAQNLITTVNAQQANGLDKSGNPGGPFFTGTNASTIAVDPTLANDPTLIAASSSTGAELDGENAHTMADVGGLVTGPDATYRQLINVLGVEAQRASNQTSIQQNITNSVDSAVQSVSGVNLDEEMTNLVRYQRAYQSAAKYMSVLDGVMDTLMGIVR